MLSSDRRYLVAMQPLYRCSCNSDILNLSTTLGTCHCPLPTLKEFAPLSNLCKFSPNSHGSSKECSMLAATWVLQLNSTYIQPFLAYVAFNKCRIVCSTRHDSKACASCSVLSNCKETCPFSSYDASRTVFGMPVPLNRFSKLRSAGHAFAPSEGLKTK